MHPVIKNILARKGKSVPVNDGRKIVLVLFGGTMAGVRGGGAMIALQELGLAHVFDEIYTLSCGFPNASYLLADDVKKGTSIYYEELSGKKFINLFRLWKIADIGYLMHVFKKIKPLDSLKVLMSKTLVYVGVKNVSLNKNEYVEIHSILPSDYFDLLEASISIPYLNPGSVKINDYKYMDSGFDNRAVTKHVDYVIDSDATDILVIYNISNQRKSKILNSDRVCEIIPEFSKISRLETDSFVLRKEAQEMGDLVKKTFGSNEPIDLNY